jgi:hypothetical protein
VWKPKTWKQGAVVLGLIWLLIRLLASYLANRVPGCLMLVEAASSVTSMFYWISLITIPILIIQFWRKTK